MAWLLENGWCVDRTHAWVYVWRDVDGQETKRRRFTSVIRAVRILKAESQRRACA